MNSKYKMFTNYLNNELQISREDIIQWTKDTIGEKVDKLIDQINVEGIIRQAAQCRLSDYKIILSEKIAKEIAGKLVITTKE